MDIKNIIITSILSLFILSCAGKKADITTLYKDSANKLETRKYLEGNLEGWGILQNKDGVVTKRFTIKITGEWEDNKGVVKRQFFFEDGKKDSRTWLITMDDNNILAVGHDILGNAAGKQHAGVSQINYLLSMDIDGVKQRVDVEETTHKVTSTSFISILSLKKGFTNKGQMVISLSKAANGESKKKSDNIAIKDISGASKPEKEISDQKKSDSSNEKSKPESKIGSHKSIQNKL